MSNCILCCRFKDPIETVDCSFQDILKNKALLGSRLMVFGGDFRQVLPVIPKASRSVIVGQCIDRATFWLHVRSIKLQTNMHVQQALQSNDTILAAELQHFAGYLFPVGQGDVPTATLPSNTPTDSILIRPEMLIQGDNLYNLIENVYSDMSLHLNGPVYFAGTAILTAKNKDISTINSNLLDYILGRLQTYRTFDTMLRTELHQLDIPVGLMNAVEHGSLPPNELNPKVGSPIMAIRNIDPASGV